ncbi:Paraquat-inducible protein A [Verrucomicrobiia bacterium DG1235]|nr:Paraquat-inducible protein A [Verrucomicrobiae bacterium DG1235]
MKAEGKRPVRAVELGGRLCSVCGRVSEADACGVCEAELRERKPHSLQRTVAWLITAVVLYVPANVWPIMTTSYLGSPTESTIIGGVVQLWLHGSYLVAGIIFLASVMVPIAKILSLAWLCWISSAGYRLSRPQHTKLYALTELLGRWSMVDICVVAVLVSLVQLGGLLKIESGTAGLAFAGVVISTMFAAHAFDPRLIWDAMARQEEEFSDE